MARPSVASPQATILAILKRSRRENVPIRRSFLRADNSAISPPLAMIVRHHDARALDLYLLVLAQASAGLFDVTYEAGVWARALDLEERNGLKSKDATVAVSKTLARLQDYKLIKRDRAGRLAHLTLLREDGSGQPYTHPADDEEPAYLQLPHAYWMAKWHNQLSLSAKVALLVSLSLPPEGFFLLLKSAHKQFAISPDTLGDGVRELEGKLLLKRDTKPQAEPLIGKGYKIDTRYTLLGPFKRRRKRKRPASATTPLHSQNPARQLSTG